VGPPFSPDGLDDLPKSVSGKTGVGVTFCHMLENHDPCDNMFWPLDQTDMALDTLDGLLEVSRGSVMWLATQGVVPARWARRHHLGMAPARWAQRTPPWHGACHPGCPMWHEVWWVAFQVGPFCSVSCYFLHTNKFLCTCGAR